MAIICRELTVSRTASIGENAGIETRWSVQGTDDEIAALNALLGVAPATYNTFARRSATVEPQGGNVWLGRVAYGVPNFSQPLAVGDALFTFETGGGVQHITQSLQTLGAYARPGSAAPDFKGAINVSSNGVEGTDITVPVFQFSETHVMAAADVTPEYRGLLYMLTGRVNDATFRGLAAGECLFLGAQGTRRGGPTGPDWEIAFRFAGSPNASGLSIGEITGINKGGWEYLWVRYTDDIDAQSVVQVPASVYVERVYKSGDFSLLNIGVDP